MANFSFLLSFSVATPSSETMVFNVASVSAIVICPSRRASRCLSAPNVVERTVVCNRLDHLNIGCNMDRTRTLQAVSRTRKPCGFFASKKRCIQPKGRVERRQYNTRKGNRPGASCKALVETRPPATNWRSATKTYKDHSHGLSSLERHMSFSLGANLPRRDQHLYHDQNPCRSWSFVSARRELCGSSRGVA